MSNYIRLGVNIDHVATLRNARGTDYPDPLRASIAAYEAGADGITLHLREDRRHIRDDDAFRIKDQVNLPINFEMAATSEMLAIALKLQPHAVCIVPEKRTEITTEGGLNLSGDTSNLQNIINSIKNAGILVSLFIDADQQAVRCAHLLGANIVEIHTGKYAASINTEQNAELATIQQIASQANEVGLEVHAGHGLTLANVSAIATISELKELNIGHAIISDAIFMGLPTAIKAMRLAMIKSKIL